MTPGARLQAAVEILDQLDATALPADRFLRDWFRARRYAGSKDRASIAERVYSVFRHRASFAWRMGHANPLTLSLSPEFGGEGYEGSASEASHTRSGVRGMVIASLLVEGKAAGEIAALFDGSTYGPAPLTDDERTAMARAPTNPPLHVLGEFPEWLEPELKRAFGNDLLAEMQAMLARAPVDLRVNTLKASRNDVLAGLHALGFKAEPAPFAPHGIRIPSGEGLSPLQRSVLFEQGAFEFQDEASQIGAALCAAKPGQRVLDLAAGAGGKSLALAAEMRNQGEVVAQDKEQSRLVQLRSRAERAGATIIKSSPPIGGSTARRAGWGATPASPPPQPSAGPPPMGEENAFDTVLVDAPCSGSGTWRRSPELKWRLTQDKLAGLAKLQDWLITDGARHTRPGGRLVYATCSILPVENEDRIEAFLKANPDFAIVEAQAVWREVAGANVSPGIGKFFHGSPRQTGTDGFFVCVMENHMDLKKGGH